MNTKSEKAMAPHSSTLAWKIPWTEEPGGLQSMGSLSRTRLSDFTFTLHFHALEKGMATHSSVLPWRIPGTGEPGGLPSMGSHRDGHDWSDLAAAAAASFGSRTRRMLKSVPVSLSVFFHLTSWFPEAIDFHLRLEELQFKLSAIPKAPNKPQALWPHDSEGKEWEKIRESEPVQPARCQRGRNTCLNHIEDETKQCSN